MSAQDLLCDVEGCKNVADWESMWDNPGYKNNNFIYYWCDMHFTNPENSYIILNSKKIRVLA